MVEIIPFSEDLKEHIRTLNVEWLEKYFFVEPGDAIQLANPKKYIIDEGGFIFYAKAEGKIVGTFSLLKIDDNTFELGKMAVTEKFQGKGIGDVMMKASIKEAESLGIKTLILYSNKSLKPAIHLYEKYGFREVPLDEGHYVRANIRMEKYFK